MLLSACQADRNTSLTQEILFENTPTPPSELPVVVETLLPTIIPTPAQTQTSVVTQKVNLDPLRETCVNNYCIYSNPFWLEKPIFPPDNNTVDLSYLFGTTQQGKYPVHAGVEFYNPTGTPVHAVAEGVVVFAGTDEKILFNHQPNTYGNLVIIQHLLNDNTYPLYSLYGHLSEISVSDGDLVSSGQIIGKVGTSGVAAGSHLHFEVRFGGIDLTNANNPELFLKPEPENGVLVIRIVNQNNEPVAVPDLVIQPEEADSTQLPRYLETYAEGASANAFWHENLVAGDLPEGNYRLTFIHEGQLIEEFIPIFRQEITYLNLQVEKGIVNFQTTGIELILISILKIVINPGGLIVDIHRVVNRLREF